jgi:hypothetical protein
VGRLKDDWASGAFTSSGMSSNEIAVANLAAVDNAQFALSIINMDYDAYRTAAENDF